jgi:hypothetical protein
MRHRTRIRTLGWLLETHHTPVSFDEIRKIWLWEKDFHRHFHSACSLPNEMLWKQPPRLSRRAKQGGFSAQADKTKSHVLILRPTVIPRVKTPSEEHNRKCYPIH